MSALLSPTEAFLLGPILAMGLCALLCSLPLGRWLPRIATCVASATSFVLALYQYTPATDKESKVLDRVGPALRDVVQFRMETVVALLMLAGFALLASIYAASRPLQSARRERSTNFSFALAAAGAQIVVVAKNAFLAFVGVEVVAVACLLHAASHAEQNRDVRSQATLLRRQLLASLLFAYGVALLYGGHGKLALLGIEAVNRPGIRAPEGLAMLGGFALFVALFMRFGAVPFARNVRREFLESPAETRLLRAGILLPALCFLLFAAAPLIPRSLLPLLPWLSGATVLVAWTATSFAETRRAREASLAGAQCGTLLIAFTALCVGSGVQDAGYAIRAGLLALVPAALAWILWIGAHACLGRAGASRAPIEDLYGLGRARPGVAILLTIAALEFAGLPPTGAFWSRLLLAKAAWTTVGPTFACACILAYSIAAIWALRVIAGIWFEQSEDEGAEATNALFGTRKGPFAVLAVVAILSVLIGLLPQLLLDSLVHIKL